MVINIVSNAGRSHLLDIARELEKHGHTVRFYSYVRKGRAMRFGLKPECCYSIFWFWVPYLIFRSLFGNVGRVHYVWQHILDYFMAFYMKPCDVLIAHSPAYVYSLKRAKKNWGTTTIIERGSAICYDYLDALKGMPGFPNTILYQNELDGYANADYITVGADHVKQGFINHGYPAEKIFVNNYGVDLSQFHPTTFQGKYDLITVGRWSFGKGCDLLVEACRLKNYSLLHVGAVTDLQFPTDLTNVVSAGFIQQYELEKYYAQAKVFAFPSRTEGCGLVQMQAIACGLPIACSQSSGGRDFRKYVDHPENIVEMKDFTVESLCECIDKALLMADKQVGLRDYAGQGICEVSFEGYGQRYNDFLLKITDAK